MHLFFLFILLYLLFVDDNGDEMEYPASPISCAHLHELRSETAKLRLSGMLQQVDFCWFIVFIFFCTYIYCTTLIFCMHYWLPSISYGSSLCLYYTRELCQNRLDVQFFYFLCISIVPVFQHCIRCWNSVGGHLYLGCQMAMDYKEIHHIQWWSRAASYHNATTSRICFGIWIILLTLCDV